MMFFSKSNLQREITSYVQGWNEKIIEARKGERIETAFLFNGRDKRDLVRPPQFQAAKAVVNILPQSSVEYFLYNFVPASVLCGVGEVDYQKVWLEAVSLLTSQLTKAEYDQMLALHIKEKIRQSIEFAERELRVKKIGLGAQLSGFIERSPDLRRFIKSKPHIEFVSGSALTAVAITEKAIALAEKNGGVDNTTFAIVGATGSIGKLVSHLLVRRGARKLILLGRSEKALEKREAEIKIFSGKSLHILRAHHSAPVVGMADVVIVVTSGDFLLNLKLRGNAEIIDVTIPSNLPSSLKKRANNCFMRNGEFKSSFDFGTPHKDLLLCCFVEVLVYTEDLNLFGEIDPATAEEVARRALSMGFKFV